MVCVRRLVSTNVRIIFVFQKGAGEWGKIDALAVGVGKDEEVVYSKSTALQVRAISILDGGSG